MDKNLSLWLIIEAVFLIVFNLIFFGIVGTVNPPSVWIAYGAISVSYLWFLASQFAAKKSKVEVDIRRPFYAVTAVFFLVCLLTGCLILYLRPDGYIVTAIVFLVIFAVEAVFFITLLLSGRHTEEKNAEQDGDAKFINASYQLLTIRSTVSDSSVANKIQTVYDLWSSSPRKSSMAAKPLENNIMNLLGDLEDACESDDYDMVAAICEKMNRLLQQRTLTIKER